MIAKLGEPTESLQVSKWVMAERHFCCCRQHGCGLCMASQLTPVQPCCRSPPTVPPQQEDFLECKRQRLEGLLAAAGLMLKTLAVDRGLLSPAGGVGCGDARQADGSQNGLVLKWFVPLNQLGFS